MDDKKRNNSDLLPAKTVDKMRLAFLASGGAYTFTGRQCNVARQTVKRYAVKYGWHKLIGVVKSKVEKKTCDDAADMAYDDVKEIGEYLRQQYDMLRRGQIMHPQSIVHGFDVKGTEIAVKLRELLGGRATERMDLLAKDFKEQFEALSPEKRNYIIAHLTREAG